MSEGTAAPFFIAPLTNINFTSYIKEKGGLRDNSYIYPGSYMREHCNAFISSLCNNKDRAQYMFKKQVGQLIGCDLKRYNQMMSVEVNDFRHRMKVFAIKKAQERRARL